MIIGHMRSILDNYHIRGSDKCSSRPYVGPVSEIADNG